MGINFMAGGGIWSKRPRRQRSRETVVEKVDIGHRKINIVRQVIGQAHRNVVLLNERIGKVERYIVGGDRVLIEVVPESQVPAVVPSARVPAVYRRCE